MDNYEIFPVPREKIEGCVLLARKVFDEEIAPYYSEEGVNEFYGFTSLESIFQLVDQKEMFFWGAFIDQELHGMIAVKKSGHISLFFVEKEWQNQGIGRALFHASYQYCANVLRVPRMTVNAAPGSVSKYSHMGFRQVNSAQNVHGIVYVPMEMYVSAGRVVDSANEKNSKVAKIVLAICVGWMIILLFGVLAYRSFPVTKTYYSQEDNEDYEDDFDEDDDDDPMDPESGFGKNRGQGAEDDVTNANNSGLDGIQPFIAQDIRYEIEEEEYSYQGENEKNIYINFKVQYPELDDLDRGIEEKVNTLIEQCALDTVHQIYDDPSMEFKEKMLTEAEPALISYVQYKVTYASNDFISIVFEEQCAKGSMEDLEIHLRSLNIDLKTGSVYEVKDIVDFSDEFMEKWLEVMKNETGNPRYLDDVSMSDLKNALSGDDTQDGKFVPNFFVSQNGIEIGFDVNVTDENSLSYGYGWVTAPFSKSEIKKYLKTNIFG